MFKIEEMQSRTSGKRGNNKLIRGGLSENVLKRGTKIGNQINIVKLQYRFFFG